MFHLSFFSFFANIVSNTGGISLEYVIFGAGRNAEYLIDNLEKQDFNILGLVDNDEKKWGMQVKNYKVFPPASLNNTFDGESIEILISVADRSMYWEIVQQLCNMGKIPGRDFRNGFEFNTLADIPGRVSGPIDLPEEFHACKSFDSASRLVMMTNAKRIFRIVFQGYESYYREILARCERYRIMGEYLIDTKEVVNQWHLPCAMVLEHRYIKPISYSFEWTPAMFGEYVIFMLNFMEKLTKASLYLNDGHHMNATIYHGNFIFLDFGAIAVSHGKIPSAPLITFLNMHLIPLVLMQRGQTKKAYTCLKNAGIEYTIFDVQGYMSKEEIELYMSMLKKTTNITDAKDMYSFLNTCKLFIEKIQNNVHATEWMGYQSDEWEKSAYPEKWSKKMKNVIRWIRRVNPSTLLDVAGNMGWYGSYFHENMKYVMIMDMDIDCLNVVWRKSHTGEYRNVIPLYMSFCAPTLANYRDEYIDESLGIYPWLPGAKQRFRADLVLSLAIVHHLAFRWQLSFEEIIGQLGSFSKKFLIIEFVDKGDQYIRDFHKERFDWYTKEKFEEILKKSFDILETAPSTPGITRTLYLCKVK